MPAFAIAQPCGDFSDSGYFHSFFDHRMAKENYREVKPNERLIALKLLQHRRLVKLSPLQQKKFGITSPSSDASHYYLVAALRATATGVFSVFVKDGCVMVLHGDLGSRDIPKQDFATTLIVKSNQPLHDAYARASIAE
jgi:hypothetical protein